MQFPEGNLNLYVTAIGEPARSELRIIVAEGLLGEPTKIDFAGTDLGEGRPIIFTDESRRFEINWANYVAYFVRNESFAIAEEGAPPFTKHLERRFDTAFMRLISETTFADEDYPGPLEHWYLATLTHCVDVVSVGPPQVIQTKRNL